MPAKRVIPCLDVKEGRVVKGVQFKELRDLGSPVELATRYDAEGADELVFLDIAATLESRGTQEAWVREVARTLSIPFTVGGGVRSVEDDGMLRKVDRLTQEAGAPMLGEDFVVVRLAEGLRSFPKAELGDRLADGTLSAETPVLDLALFNLGQLRQGQLEKPLARTWIGRKFKLAVPA